VRRLRLRGNWSHDVVIFLLLLVVALAILTSWQLGNPHTHQRHAPPARER
jgi:hypothetical protein